MKRTAMVFLFIVCGIVLFMGDVYGGEIQEDREKRLVVIGVKNEIGRKEWNDQLIGYGLSHMLLQGLFDTGHYVPVEDNPEVLLESQRLIKTQWGDHSGFYTPGQADGLSESLECDAVAYARAVKFTKKRKRSFAGPFSSAATRITVEMEVYLKERDKPVMVAKGKGSALTKSRGFLFEIRKDQVYFDKTAVGQASQEAMANAVKGLNIK